MNIDFDRYFFRVLDYLRIWLKHVFTRLGLRDKQSCKHCGRNQFLIWSVKDKLWNEIPKKYRDHSLCIECFIKLCPKKIKLTDFDFIEKGE